MPPGPLSINGYIEQFEAVRKALKILSWGVVGQSYAAGLAIRYAIREPDYVNALMVTNSRSALGHMDTNRATNVQPPNKRADNPRQDNRHLPIHPVYAKRISEPTKSILVKAADRVSHVAIAAGGALASELNAIALLPEIPCPFLIANGRKEKSFQEELDRLRSVRPIPVANLAGGHAVNIEAADAFNKLAAKFFGR